MLTSSSFELFFDCVVSCLLPFIMAQIARDFFVILARYGDGGSGC